MNSAEAIELLDSVAGRLGDDTQLETVTADLISLKDYISGIDATIEALNEDVNRLNEKNRGLLQSNNTLYRQISRQQETMENANEEVKKLSTLASLF